MLIYFNVTKFCKFTGEYSELSDIYNVVCIIMFSLIGFVIVASNTFVLITVIRQASFRHSRNIFLVSLIFSDFLYGMIFIPLFVIELSSKEYRQTCTLRSWRVVAFMYFFSVRFLSVFFISLYTYIRTCKTRTAVETYFNKYIHGINIFIVWLLTLLLISVLGITPIRTDKVLATIIYTYFLASMMCVVVTYIITLNAIRRAKERSAIVTYTEAIDFVRWILTWFLSTNIPLALCGIVLLVFAYNRQLKDAYLFIEHQIFVICIAIASLDAVANPIVYLRKFKEFREQLSLIFPEIFNSKSDRKTQIVAKIHKEKTSHDKYKAPMKMIHVEDGDMKYSHKNNAFQKEQDTIIDMNK